MIVDAHVHPYFNRTSTKGLGFIGNMEGVFTYLGLKYLRNEYGVRRLARYLLERMARNGIGVLLRGPTRPEGGPDS
ncbi:MAG: hypothetical protein ACTSSA_15785 [Candidatus Freyarchaeota archaeon]